MRPEDVDHLASSGCSICRDIANRELEGQIARTGRVTRLYREHKVFWLFELILITHCLGLALIEDSVGGKLLVFFLPVTAVTAINWKWLWRDG